MSSNFLVPQQTFRKRWVLNILLTIYFGISQIDLKSWCCSFWVNVTKLPLGILALLDITWLYSRLGFLPLLWLVLLGLPWDRCLCVLQHPNASGLGSVASSLVTCCLAELPPFGFNHHPLADNSKSSPELCLHPGPVSTRAASARVLWTSHMPDGIHHFHPHTSPDPLLLLCSIAWWVHQCQFKRPTQKSRQHSGTLFPLPTPSRHKPSRVSHQIISGTCAFLSISLSYVFILTPFSLAEIPAFHCSSYLNGSPTIFLKPKTDLFLLLFKNFLKFLEMIFKALSWKIKIDYCLAPATLSNNFLDGWDHGTPGFHNVCGGNKCVFFFYSLGSDIGIFSAWSWVT